MGGKVRASKAEAIIREQVDRLGRPSTELLNREIARFERKESYHKLLRNVLIALVMVVAIIFIATNLWFSVFLIDSSCMNPQLEVDDVVFALVTDNPEVLDIIAFTRDERLLVKRVIATAGDWVNVDTEGVVTVNGKVLVEPNAAEPNLGNGDVDYPYLVPSGTVFVLDDNRLVSEENRNEQIGPVSREQIIGKVVFRVWPLSRLGGV